MIRDPRFYRCYTEIAWAAFYVLLMPVLGFVVRLLIEGTPAAMDSLYLLIFLASWVILARLAWHHYRTSIHAFDLAIWEVYTDHLEVASMMPDRKLLVDIWISHPLSALPGNWECVDRLEPRLTLPPTTSS